MSESIPAQTVWDVLIAGAGPSGSRLAQQLAEAGASVLVVDALADFSDNAFSSAALPLSAVQHWRLPERVIAARWDQWQLFGPGERQRHWSQRAAITRSGNRQCWTALRGRAALLNALPEKSARASTTRTDAPDSASCCAKRDPEGPAPAISTSQTV